VEGLLSGVNIKHIDELLRPANQIREVIRSSPLPDQLYDGILEGCRQFPYLQAAGPEGILDAIRSWWASLFDSAAIFYRELNGQRHHDASITVAAQKKPGPESNGRD